MEKSNNSINKMMLLLLRRLRRNCILFFLIAELLISFISCKKESALPIIETIPASGILGTAAQSGGIIISTKTSSILEFGVCWSTAPNPDINNFSYKVQSSGLTGSFKAFMLNLNPDTEYYYCAYVYTDNGWAYGNVLHFRTQSTNTSFLITSSLKLLTLRTFRVSAYSEYNFPNLMRAGFCYSTHPNPTINDNVINLTITSSWDSNVTLKSSEIHYVRSFIELQDGQVYYGNELTAIPGYIDIVSVDKLTFRSARITIKADPVPMASNILLRDSLNGTLRYFPPKDSTTYQAYHINLKPETAYNVTAIAGFYDLDFSEYDYIGSVGFTTWQMPYTGSGINEDPYTIDGALHYQSFPDQVWLEGYIVGNYKEIGLGNFEPPFDDPYHILIATDYEEGYKYNTIKVILPVGAIQDTLNLKANPGNKGKRIKILGKVGQNSVNMIELTEVSDFELF